jgi:hypothetical protein
MLGVFFSPDLPLHQLHSFRLEDDYHDPSMVSYPALVDDVLWTRPSFVAQKSTGHPALLSLGPRNGETVSRKRM